MIRRLGAAGGLAAVMVLSTAGPAAADNCGGLTDCLPTAKSLLIALGAVLVIAGVVAMGFGGAVLLGAAMGGGGLAGGLSLAGGGVIASAGAISVTSAIEITAAGALATTSGVMMANAADSSGSPGSSPQKGSSGAQPSGGGADPFKGGGTPRASDIARWAESKGWTRTQTPNGPVKYIDENGIPRVTIKQGSPRTPGSETPHVELRDPTGRRIDPSGNPVSRRSPANHSPIDWDWSP